MRKLVTIRMILAFTLPITLYKIQTLLSQSHFEEHIVYLFSEVQDDGEKEIEVK